MKRCSFHFFFWRHFFMITEDDNATFIEIYELFLKPYFLLNSEKRIILGHSLVTYGFNAAYQYRKNLLDDRLILSIYLIDGTENDNDTRCSQAVTHPSTNRARCCLTSVIGRELVFSAWYGRCRQVGGFCSVSTCA